MPDRWRGSSVERDSGKAKADCNQVGGTYEVHRGGTESGAPDPTGGHISILPGPSSLAACPRGLLADLFVIALGNAAGFGIADNQLTLTDGDAAPTLFTA